MDATALQQAVWQRVCGHLDGLAIGGTVAALSQTGALDALFAGGDAVPVVDWAATHGLRPGYANLAGRLLALQGFVRREGDIVGGRAALRPTDTGQAWRRLHPLYRSAPATIDAAQRLLAALQDDPDNMAIADVAAASTARDMPDRVRDHMRGPLVAAALTGLARSGALDALAGERDGVAETALAPAVSRALAVIEAEGWATSAGGRVALTVAGRVAAAMAPQYFYPAGYLAMLAAVPALMCGIAVDGLEVDAAGTEGHVDREIDIAFSGIVFARTCREPLFEIALPLFDTDTLKNQPRAIVDCGGGDGTLLCELYRAIAERTRRGANLADAPLTMVGVEYNPVAERTLARRMRDEGVPGFTFAGDIGKPAAIADRLAAEGLGRDAVLHVSKSVFHNRTYRLPATAVDDATSAAAFVAPGGDLIAAPDMEADLARTLADWRAQLGRHGMVVIEAHCVDEALTAARVGRSVLTGVEALHGFSHQYLVEVDVHRRAANRAGLQALSRREIGAAYAGAPIMSIDHYAA